jgi:hypothetical protein
VNQPDTSKRVLFWLRFIGFGGLATIAAAAITVSRMQIDNQSNIRALMQQQSKAAQDLEKLNAAVIDVSDRLHVQQYRTAEAERRITTLEGGNHATGNR